MATHQEALKGTAAYYCGGLSDNETYMCSFLDPRHHAHHELYEVPEGVSVGSEAAIKAAVDTAVASLPAALSRRSNEDEAYLLGGAPAMPVLTAAGVGIPVTNNATAVVGSGGELPVATRCSVLVTNYRTMVVVEATPIAHQQWGTTATVDRGFGSVMVGGACYDVNLQIPEGSSRALSVVLVRRVAEVISVPHMVLTEPPRGVAPTQAIVEDWAGFSRILSLNPLLFISKVIGGCGPMGGEMRLAFVDPARSKGVLQNVRGMRLTTAPPVSIPEGVQLVEPTTELLAALHPMTLLRRMPAYEFFSGSEADTDFGWSVHDERREMLRCLTIYDPKVVSAPDDPAQYHAFGAAGTGCDLRPWFRLTPLHPSAAADENSSDDLSTVTPLIAGYGPTATYPLRVCVPAAATDAFLIDACFPGRSRQRIPAVSYVNLRTGAVLCRSSQPLRSRATANASDEELCRYMVNHYTTYNSGHRNTAAPVAATHANPGSPTSSFSPPPSIVNRAPPSLTSSMVRKPQEQVVAQKGGGTLVTSVISTGPQTLSIVDCRPRSAAMANDTLGGGYERHDLGRVKFFGIENIHAVTGSYAKLRQLLTTHAGMMSVGGGSGTPVVGYPRSNGSIRSLNVVHAGGVSHTVGGSSDFHRGFWAETSWMIHIQRVLICALETAEYIERGESALVHCTDGWDRTSQTTALAMIMMDPFYRTVRGLCLVIEKEFAQFGHKFAERLGHMSPYMDTTYSSTSGVRSSDTEGGAAADATPSNSKQQPSPVFLQFLDALFQIVRQFPTAFEFTTQLLVFIAEHCSSCLYGTFICNNAKERLFEGISVGSQSIWTDILTACDLERRGLITPFLLEPTYDSERAMWFITKRPLYPAPPQEGEQPPTPAPQGPSWNLSRAPAKDGAPMHTHNNCGIDFIRPSVSSKRLVFWEEFYLRHDPDRALIPVAGSTTTSSFRVSAVLAADQPLESLQKAVIAVPHSTISPATLVPARCRTQLVFPASRLSRGSATTFAPPGHVGPASIYTTIAEPSIDSSTTTTPLPLIVLQFTAVEVCGVARREAMDVPSSNVVPLTSGPMYNDEFLEWNQHEMEAMKEHRRRDVRAIFKVHQLAHWHRNGGVGSTDQVAILRSRLGGSHPFLLTDSELFTLPPCNNVRFLGASDQAGSEMQEDQAVIQHKSKRCSQCSTSFGMWGSRYYCDSCAKESTLGGLPLCRKCIRSTSDGRSLCINCFAIEA